MIWWMFRTERFPLKLRSALCVSGCITCISARAVDNLACIVPTFSPFSSFLFDLFIHSIYLFIYDCTHFSLLYYFLFIFILSLSFFSHLLSSSPLFLPPLISLTHPFSFLPPSFLLPCASSFPNSLSFSPLLL